MPKDIFGIDWGKVWERGSGAIKEGIRGPATNRTMQGRNEQSRTNFWTGNQFDNFVNPLLKKAQNFFQPFSDFSASISNPDSRGISPMERMIGGIPLALFDYLKSQSHLENPNLTKFGGGGGPSMGGGGSNARPSGRTYYDIIFDLLKKNVFNKK